MTSPREKAHKLNVSEQAIKRWAQTAWNIAFLFKELAGAEISLKRVYDFIRTWHLRTPGSIFSEQGVRAALDRFVEKGYLSKRKLPGKKKVRLFSATRLGVDVFNLAHDLQIVWELESSLDDEDYRRVLLADRAGELMLKDSRAQQKIEIVYKKWTDVVAIDSGWPENRKVTKVKLDPWIIQQVRSIIPGQPASNAGWLFVKGDQFRMRVSKITTIDMWVGNQNWKDELSDWMKSVPNLEDKHLDQIWSRIAERCGHQEITIEYHVVDPRFATVRPHLFRGDQSQRWKATDIAHFQILSRSEVTTRGGDLRPDERSPGRLCQSSRSVRSSSPLRTQIQRTVGNHNPPIAEVVRLEVRAVEETIRPRDRTLEARATFRDSETERRASGAPGFSEVAIAGGI